MKDWIARKLGLPTESELLTAHAEIRQSVDRYYLLFRSHSLLESENATYRARFQKEGIGVVYVDNPNSVGNMIAQAVGKFNETILKFQDFRIHIQDDIAGFSRSDGPKDESEAERGPVAATKSVLSLHLNGEDWTITCERQPKLIIEGTP